MAHKRKTLRATFRQALEDANTAAGARVFKDRETSLRTTELPAIVLYTDDEDAEDRGYAPRELVRVLSVVIEGYVAATEDVDDAMDDLAEQIEPVMEGDPQWGGLTSDVLLVKTELETGVLGDRQVGRVRLTYEVTYYTASPAWVDDANLDDFNRVHATHNLGNAVQEDEDAEDDFTVQEEAP